MVWKRSGKHMAYGVNTGEKMPFDEKQNISAKKQNKICQALDYSFASIPAQNSSRTA